MSDIESIADTIAAEFTAAVRAANKAKTQHIDNILGMITDAEQERTASLADVRRLQEEAAKIVAESIRLAEKTENRYHDQMRGALIELHDMRGPSPLTARSNMRAISGGKQSEA